MSHASALLLAGSLDHLLRHALTGCLHSGRHAAYLLERVAAQGEVDAELRHLCGQMSERLAEGGTPFVPDLGGTRHG